MEDDEILPDESISQVSSSSFSKNLSSHFPVSLTQRPAPKGVLIVDRCKVVVNTPECLEALEPFMQKVYQSMFRN